MPRKISAGERAHIEKQIAQISAFLEHCYDGMCHDVQLVWTLRDGFNPVQKIEHKSYHGADDYIARKGEHRQIDVGYGDAYYGSSSLGRMLHEAAYDWREKLLARLEDDKSVVTESTVADLYRTA